MQLYKPKDYNTFIELDSKMMAWIENGPKKTQLLQALLPCNPAR
jgi:hypothetical protein